MDDLVVERRAEGLAGLVGAQAADAAGVGGGVVGESAGEFVAVGVADADDVALVELADHLDDADGQQALRARFERPAGAGVDDVVAARPRGQADPALAARGGSAVRPGTSVPTGSPARMRVKGFGCVPEAMITEPPAWVTSRAAASLLCMPPVPRRCVLAPARLSTSSSIWGTSETTSGHGRGARLGSIEAVDDAQDDQQRRLEQVGDHGGQTVVVAELDLVDADRVVLVDDRHGVAFEQGVQRVPHVEVAGPAVEVFMGQQELGGVAAMPAQALVVGADQVRLADGGGGLKLGQVVGPALASRAGPCPAPTAPELTSATLRPVSITVLICSAR